MMDQNAMPPEWLAFLSRYGIPSTLAVAAYWAVPKIWKYFSQRLGIAQQTNDLAQAGLSGVADVIAALRTQMGDLTIQFKDVEQKLKDMSATLDQAVQAKLLAQQEAAKAKSDLYVLQLYVERLRAQIQNLGQTPLAEPILQTGNTP